MTQPIQPAGEVHRGEPDEPRRLDRPRDRMVDPTVNVQPSDQVIRFAGGCKLFLFSPRPRILIQGDHGECSTGSSWGTNWRWQRITPGHPERRRLQMDCVWDAALGGGRLVPVFCNSSGLQTEPQRFVRRSFTFGHACLTPYPRATSSPLRFPGTSGTQRGIPAQRLRQLRHAGSDCRPPVGPT